jgi:UDP:flavonoid glycosyltransferase YjiC (YdhE family)
VLDLGQILSQRGHTIEFATHDGYEIWLKEYPFVKKVHLMGPPPNAAELRAHSERMRLWDIAQGFEAPFISKKLFDASWPRVYQFLKSLVEDDTTKPDMIVSDYFVDAAKDIHFEFKVPLAVVWPQFPYGMLRCPYIPGQPGMQVDIALTSENSSLRSRIRNEMVILHSIPHALEHRRWMNRLRRKAGVSYSLPPMISKPDYLVLVNSFFGLEVPRDLPPLAAAVGPILGDEYPPLSSDYESLLNNCTRTVYVGLGTRVILLSTDIERILQGLISAMNNDLIDGVIWALASAGRENLDPKQTYEIKGLTLTFCDLLDGIHPNWMFPIFAPQRAILEHPATKVFLTHGGGSSANEGCFHGKLMLCLSFSFDQLCNAARLCAAGTAESIDKRTFTSDEISRKIEILMNDLDGRFERNRLRMQYISRIAARNKYLGASLIEQVMFDTEFRMVKGNEKRPMHLETADMRMPIWKSRNWDLMVLAAAVVIGVIGSILWVGKVILIGLVGLLGKLNQ